MTPEEAFTGEKPEIGHFRIFGCLVYVHVPRERRTKLDPSSKKGIFVGCSEFAKAYRIYIPGQRKIELSRDGTFKENIAYWRSRHAESDSDGQEAPQDVLAPLLLRLRGSLSRRTIQLLQQIQLIQLFQIQFPEMLLRWVRKESQHGFDRHCRMLRAMQLPEGQLRRARDL